MQEAVVRKEIVPDVAPAAPVVAYPITLRRKAIVGWLGTAILVLTILSFAGQISRFYFGHPTVFGLVPFFYLDLESNLPTWYQSTSLLFAALLLAAVGVAVRRKGGEFGAHWFGLAALVLFLSLDEMAMVHERAIEPIQRLTGRPDGIWAPTWIFMGLILVAAVGLFFLRFFLHLKRAMQLRLLAAAALFVFGSVGLEMVAAGIGGDKETFAYVILTHSEEFLEMVAVLILIDALLRHLEGTPPIRIGFAG